MIAGIKKGLQVQIISPIGVHRFEGVSVCLSVRKFLAFLQLNLLNYFENFHAALGGA